MADWYLNKGSLNDKESVGEAVCFFNNECNFLSANENFTDIIYGNKKF